jgi:hypothetical protein
MADDKDKDEELSGMHEHPALREYAVLVELRQQRRDQRERDEMLAAALRDSWLSYAREVLSGPVWPNRIAIRGDMAILLVAAVFFLFGSDRAWSMIEWVADRAPRISIGEARSNVSEPQTPVPVPGPEVRP